MPKRCPLCKAEIVKPEGEAMHRCPNDDCPSRGLESLISWVQAAADIEGVGEQSVRQFWELGIVRSLPDLYSLTKEQLVELEGYADISASNARSRRSKLPGIPFMRVLFGLNIPDVGWVTAREPSPVISRTSTACSRPMPLRSKRWTASGRTGRSRLRRGSRTRRTERWSPSCGNLGFASSSARRTGPWKGR